MVTLGQLQIQANRPIHDLQGSVFAHVGKTEKALEFSRLADGIVLRGASGVRSARIVGRTALVAIDVERYIKDRGKPPLTPAMFSETPAEAVASQMDLGASVLLAPSRFPDDRSDQSIQTMLAQGAEFVAQAAADAPAVPAFVPVVIRFDELTDRRWVGPIRESGLPIATIFASYGDPLGAPRQLEGALEVIDAATDLFVLRCDISVAGMIALGAVSGAIGTSSSVRHLWLPRKGSPRSPSPSIFVPRLANWMKIEFAKQALADPDLDEVFRCECSVCGADGDVRRLVQDGSSLADEHSAASAVGLTREVIGSSDPVSTWRATCAQASSAYDLLVGLDISGPSKPGALSSWLQILG